MAQKANNLREALILAGIAEINKNGITALSARRIAKACGVACAASYRHFESKQAFISAIIDYVNGLWSVRQQEILEKCGNSLQERLVEVTLGYIRFLMDEPTYCSILMFKDLQFDNLYHKKANCLKSVAQQMEIEYFESSGLSEEDWNRKLMTFRSLMFGLVFLFSAGEFEYNDTNMKRVRYVLNREFEIL